MLYSLELETYASRSSSWSYCGRLKVAAHDRAQLGKTVRMKDGILRQQPLALWVYFVFLRRLISFIRGHQLQRSTGPRSPAEAVLQGLAGWWWYWSRPWWQPFIETCARTWYLVLRSLLEPGSVLYAILIFNDDAIYGHAVGGKDVYVYIYTHRYIHIYASIYPQLVHGISDKSVWRMYIIVYYFCFWQCVIINSRNTGTW